TTYEDAARQGGLWLAAEAEPAVKVAGDKLELRAAEFAGDTGQYPYLFQPYPSLQFHEGSGANLPWMQELPDPASSSIWGLPVDLDRCTGCEACVVACHAENNLPISTPEQAATGRTVHWIRVDRYYEGEFPDVKVKYMPVLCQHCEEAPCEPVCPTYATYHNNEGLNVQVYNRCVGTFYCANNCPYTVRYFNWFDPVWPEPMQLQHNPDVSVRMAGVMEKCSFCIQRIKRSKQDATRDGRPLADGD